MAKILIIDDASFMRSSLKYILESAGHTIVGMAASGKELLELYKKLKPDVVTLDILMEELDGLRALELLKKDHPSSKVVMVTALGQESKHQEANKLGADGYIRKPFKVKEITDEIERVLKTK